MFPEEIYFEILLRLPVKSACVCKCVCKNWFSLISNPRFVQSHLNLTVQKNNPSLILEGTDEIYSINHDSIPSLLSTDIEFNEYAVEMDFPFKSSYDIVKLVGCFHGLVCLLLSRYGDFDDILCIWNPTTREYKKLPKSPNADYRYHMIGLGYDCKSDDYKLVTCHIQGLVEVYSVELNSWTCIENVPYKFCSDQKVGAVVCGDSHWLAEAQNCSQVVVVTFDFGNQIFKEIQLPNELLKKNCKDMALGVLEGCLSVHVLGAEVHSQWMYKKREKSDVWVMQDYGVQESWIKRFKIVESGDNVPRCMLSFKSDEILFVGLFFEEIDIYDTKDECVRKANFPALYELGCYHESLVSLRSGTYVGEDEEEAEEEEVEKLCFSLWSSS